MSDSAWPRRLAVASIGAGRRVATQLSWPLLGLLAFAWALRATLAMRGGQMFWLDEANRWAPGVQIATALRHHGDAHEAMVILTRESAQHVGFFLFTVPAATLYELLGKGPTALSVTTTILSLASVSVVALVYALALRVGAKRDEALLAATLAAATACLAVYSRHVLPYDASMALALAALWLALDPRTSWTRSIWVGVVSGLALLTYYGNQSLVVTVLAVHVLAGKPRHIRILGAAAGLSFLLIELQLVTVATGGPGFVQRFWTHQVGNGVRTMKDVQGDLAEGWLLPFRYFWASEHGLAIVWLLALVATPFLARKRPYLWWWFAIVVALYAQLTLFSTGLHLAAALGRLTRPMAPVLCLLTAGIVASLPVRRSYAIAALLALAAQAFWNVSAPLQQVWPSQLHRDTKPKHSLITVRGPEEAGKTVCDVDNLPSTGVVLVNTCTWLYPIRDVHPHIEGRTIESWPHPLQYVPYQYEVLNPEMRAIVARADLTMRLIDQDDKAAGR